MPRESQFRISLSERQYGLSGSQLVEYVIERYRPRRVAVAFSGGIDSLATALMVADSIPESIRIYLVFVNTTNEIPTNLKYTRKMLRWFENHYENIKGVELIPKKHYSEFLIENFRIAVRIYLEKRWHKHNFRCCYYLKEKPAKDFYEKMNIRIFFSGLRGEESYQRYLFAKETRGIFDKGKFIHVMPLWNWSRSQVVDYVLNHPLRPPLNPVYNQGFDGTGCMLCPVKFLFGEKDSLPALRNHYPKAYVLGMALKQYYIAKFTGQQPLVKIDHPIIQLVEEYERRRIRQRA
ncbi:MAG: phosphoadenosine phosphosulfate reductase domain-containing protein [Candidatus Njordarchaeales archaeon]